MWRAASTVLATVATLALVLAAPAGAVRVATTVPPPATVPTVPDTSTFVDQFVEHIASFDAAIDVGADGTLHVRETIAYDFSVVPHHGIFRDIPTVFSLPNDSRHERVTPLTVRSVTATPAGTSAHYVLESGGTGVTRIRIGAADSTVTGRHTYVIDYDVRGALDRYTDHVELKWDATGNFWKVPISQTRVTVTVPGGVRRVACYSGAQGASLSCTRARILSGAGRFLQTRLGPYEGVTVVVAIDPKLVSGTAPIIRTKPQRGFVVDAATLGVFGGALVAAALALFLLARRGRDRRYAGSPIDAAMGSSTAADERIPLGERVEMPVQFEPPDKLRPGELGTLLDGIANPLDVSATIIDLAARGWLSIEELPKAHSWSKADWKLHRLRDDTVDSGELQEYERSLLDGLFGSSREVDLSDLRRKFATKMSQVQTALYKDVVAKGWFRGRPDSVRGKWAALAIVVTVAGIPLTIVLASATKFGLAGLPVIAFGVGLLMLVRVMPVRTAAGTAVLRRARGFKKFMESFTEEQRAQFAERKNLFYDYLPYAIVFGVADHWAQVFGPLADAPPSWYSGTQPFTALAFAHSVGSFASTSVATLSAAASTSSGGSGFSSGFGGGGFSGGGFGGGGGGSW